MQRLKQTRAVQDLEDRLHMAFPGFEDTVGSEGLLD